jgi:hypothetical protein
MTGRLKISHCTSCGEFFDAATSFADPGAKPAPDDWTICLYCGHLMAFDADLRVRDLTDEERSDAARDEEVAALLRARNAVMP